MQASGKVLQKNQVTNCFHRLVTLSDQKCVTVQLACACACVCVWVCVWVCVCQLEKMQKEPVLLQELQQLQITP